MVTAGIDAGSEYLKVVLLNDGEILSWADLNYGTQSVLVTAQTGLSEALDKAGIGQAEIEYIGAAGINRGKVTFAHEYLIESICCAQGAAQFVPSAKTIIDLGLDKVVCRISANKPS